MDVMVTVCDRSAEAGGRQSDRVTTFNRGSTVCAYCVISSIFTIRNASWDIFDSHFHHGRLSCMFRRAFV